MVEFDVDVFNPGPIEFPAADLTLQIESAGGASRMDTLSVAVADGDGPWRPLQRTAGGELSFVARLTEFRPLPAGTRRTFHLRLHLDPAQPGAVNPGAMLTITRTDGCPARTSNSGFDLPVRAATPAATATSSVPVVIGAATGAAITLSALWLLSRRRRSHRT